MTLADDSSGGIMGSFLYGECVLFGVSAGLLWVIYLELCHIRRLLESRR